MGRFRNDTLDAETLEKTIPDFARACEPRAQWSPTGLDQAICYHGMGHLLMFITNADIRRSLDVCERIGVSQTGNYLRVCREGVFMQIYQPLEPDDFALIELLPVKPTKENYRALCAAYTKDEEEGACLREAWPFYRDELLDASGTAQFCAGQPNVTEEAACFESALTIIGRQSLGEHERAGTACMQVPEQYQVQCFTIVAQAVLEEDRTEGERALSFCGRAPAGVVEQCMYDLGSRAHWIFGNDTRGREEFCSFIPEAQRSACL